jgi:hypothetical protein
MSQFANENKGRGEIQKTLKIRDEENTKSENDITNTAICSEGSRVVQYQTLLLFPIFYGTPAPT